jgi:hypothetical protein
MSSETDQPRQRTVAELLAEHGETAATGRRRRRREADGSDEGVVGFGVAARAPDVERRLPSALPPRSVLREPVPPGPVPYRPYLPTDPAPAEVPRRHEVLDLRPPLDREYPTEQITPVRDVRERWIPEIDPTGPIPTAAAPARPVEASVPTEEPAPRIAVGAPPVVREARFSVARPVADAGPATHASPMDLEAFDDVDDQPAGLGDELVEPDEDTDEEQTGIRRRLALAGAGQAWAAVLAQWIAGAVGGALLWVGFRYLWRHLPVVALAAAVVATVGLVVVVRMLLQNDDRRTTIFAVLVGLLLTISPAVLVLFGR